MSNLNRSATAATYAHNRLAAIMLHTSRYSKWGCMRLAENTGLSKSEISKLRLGKTNPLYSTVTRVVKAIQSELNRGIDPAEIFSNDGTYPTPHVCQLMGCSGCLPDHAYDADFDLLPDWQGVKGGAWSGDVAYQPRARKR